MSAPSSDTAAIRQIIRALKAAGYTLDHVNDGEEEVKVSTEQEAIDAITAVDMAHLFVDHPTERSSHVWFVLGNDPEEVAADYGVSLEPVIGPLTRSWWSLGTRRRGIDRHPAIDEQFRRDAAEIRDAETSVDLTARVSDLPATGVTSSDGDRGLSDEEFNAHGDLAGRMPWDQKVFTEADVLAILASSAPATASDLHADLTAQVNDWDERAPRWVITRLRAILAAHAPSSVTEPIHDHDCESRGCTHCEVCGVGVLYGSRCSAHPMPGSSGAVALPATGVTSSDGDRGLSDEEFNAHGDLAGRMPWDQKVFTEADVLAILASSGSEDAVQVETVTLTDIQRGSLQDLLNEYDNGTVSLELCEAFAEAVREIL